MIVKVTLIIFAVCLAIMGCGCNKTPTNSIEPPPTEPYATTDCDPTWSPDGATIAYAHHSLSDTQSGIFLINPDGSNKRLFLESIESQTLWHKPDWSPDGNWLVLCETYSAQIYKIRVPEGDSLTQLTTMGSNFFPTWSPDGKKIAWDTSYMDSLGANVIWTMDADGNNKKDISQHQVGEWRMPDWYTSDHIVHIRYPGGSTYSSEIFIMDSSGQNPVGLTNNNNTDYYPKGSPNSSKIVFSSQADGQGPRVWVVNSDGSNPTKLTETGGDHPAWSPGGTKIVYCNTVDGRLWTMNADGTNKIQLTF